MNSIKKLKWAEYPRRRALHAVENPFCGLYSIHRFYIGSEIAHDQHVPIEQCALREGQTLCLVEINLKQYADTALPDHALAIAERIFAFFTRSQRGMLVRFLYDWDGRNIQSEPKQLQTILDHMDQLSPLLKKYAPWIYVLQGLFIGNWGEMHNSRFLAPTSICALAERLFMCSGQESFLAVRSPALWRVVARSFEPLEAGEAQSGRMNARVGLFNDGMFASSTDYGTYGTMARSEARTHADKWTREDELAFQTRLCQYVPNGGEAINPCPQNDFYNAAVELKAMRVSYLNSAYDIRVLDKWRDTPIRRSWGAWHGRTGFEYIHAHLGYRYTVQAVSLQVASAADHKLRASLTVRNEGFAPCYRKLSVAIVSRNATTGERLVTALDVDVGRWLPDHTTALSAEFVIGDWMRQRILLCLALRDELSGQCVRVANAFTYIASDGDNVLGAFELREA